MVSCLDGVGLPVNAAVLKDSVEQVHLLMFAQDLPVPVEKVAGIIDLAAVQLRDGSGHENFTTKMICPLARLLRN